MTMQTTSRSKIQGAKMGTRRSRPNTRTLCQEALRGATYNTRNPLLQNICQVKRNAPRTPQNFENTRLRPTAYTRLSEETPFSRIWREPLGHPSQTLLDSHVHLHLAFLRGQGRGGALGHAPRPALRCVPSGRRLLAELLLEHRDPVLNLPHLELWRPLPLQGLPPLSHR